MNEAPLKKFAEYRATLDNKLFTDYNGFPFIVGQLVSGTWVDYDGRAFHAKGKIDYNEKTGFWVVDDSGGITPVKDFWTMEFQTEFLTPPTL